ncbi:unnamed protein product [Symbiodinium natans]|uniref:Uncharacterized protein n=1 Tax=Symbiodinium natans TaxID=878477 RepID=A0A812PDZ5_9DINO|nr:unnamed protein product [Symbiodinium natans]
MRSHSAQSKYCRSSTSYSGHPAICASWFDGFWCGIVCKYDTHWALMCVAIGAQPTHSDAFHLEVRLSTDSWCHGRKFATSGRRASETFLQTLCYVQNHRATCDSYIPFLPNESA